jgi:sodium-dependent dicarboxylate transporter 2/3/5
MSASKDMKYYIYAAIGLIVMFGFSFVVQPFGPVTELGVKYLGIFIGLIWLWSTCDMGWPVFAAFVAMLVLKCDTVTTVLTGYSNFAVMMSIFTMMAIMPVAEASGMFSYIAKWLMNQKFI